MLLSLSVHVRVALTRPGTGSRGDAPPPWTLSERGCSRCSAGCSAACCSSATSELLKTCSQHTLPLPGNQTPTRSTKSCHRQVLKARRKSSFAAKSSEVRFPTFALTNHHGLGNYVCLLNELKNLQKWLRSMISENRVL